MNYTKMKYFGLGLAVSAILMSITMGYADGMNKLIVDGKQVQSDVPLQVINGHTMVPLRVIGEALGATVTCDKANNAIIINTKGNGTATDLSNTSSVQLNRVNLLNQLKPFKLTNANQKSLTIDGTNYNEALILQGGKSGTAYWNLDGKYSRLTISAGSPINDYYVKGDNKILAYADGDYSSGVRSLTVDVSGVKILSIESGLYMGNFVIVDMQASK